MLVKEFDHRSRVLAKEVLADEAPCIAVLDPMQLFVLAGEQVIVLLHIVRDLRVSELSSGRFRHEPYSQETMAITSRHAWLA